MTGQLPQFSLVPTPLDKVIQESNSHGSTVLLMIETKDSIANINEIAEVEGVDVLLVGSNDLSIELGVAAKFESDIFKSALTAVSEACKYHKKVFGLAGIYDKPDYQRWAVNNLGVRFILGGQDSSVLTSGTKQCMAALMSIESLE